MKILQVIPGLSKAAGTSVFCGELANELAKNGHALTVAVCNPNVADHYPLDSRIGLISIDAVLCASRATSDYDIVHIHSLWLPALHQVSVWAHKNGIPVVWSPHGMITPWAMRNKRFKKLIGWHLYQKRDLQSAALLHATAESEVDDIRRMGLKNEVVIAPLGVHIHKSNNRAIEQSNIRTLLFVSRVQRKKGLPNLIEAWSRLPEDLRKSWQVRIVGPDQDNHTAELKVQCDRLGIPYSDETRIEQSNNRTIEQFVFVGPKYGNELAAEYDNADLFVLPTHSENFGSVVIEALAHGVPVITTKEAPWAELEEFKCGWWIDDDVESLTAALHDACDVAGVRALTDRGLRGRQLVEGRYSWKRVAQAMVTKYVDIIRRR